MIEAEVREEMFKEMERKMREMEDMFAQRLRLEVRIFLRPFNGKLILRRRWSTMRTKQIVSLISSMGSKPTAVVDREKRMMMNLI
jgi:hypothetical protein